jgi:prepilin-type N-terminal cleavage/methylation domain-containing protein
MRRIGPNHAAGFTLVEVLVVIGVIGVLMGLVLPAMASFKNEAKSTLCLNNLRQLYGALETSRQARKDTFPFAAPLPVPAGQIGIVESLPESLKSILPIESEVWMCPADQSQDSQDIGTSYIYVPGAWMLAEPPMPSDPDVAPLSDAANRMRVAKLVTDRFTHGFFHTLPLLADSDDYHRNGNRHPRNAVFPDGNARVVKPSDGDVLQP